MNITPSSILLSAIFYSDNPSALIPLLEQLSQVAEVQEVIRNDESLSFQVISIDKENKESSSNSGQNGSTSGYY